MEEPQADRLDQTDERVDLIAEYEERLVAAADLIARVRHEINNPLTGLIGQTQLLLREDLSDTARRRVEIIERLATRIRDLAAELRDVQRPARTITNGERKNRKDELPG
jgi:signal transduction histidine kinase